MIASRKLRRADNLTTGQGLLHTKTVGGHHVRLTDEIAFLPVRANVNDIVRMEFQGFFGGDSFSVKDSSGEITFAAKPFLLRQTPFDGSNRGSVHYSYLNSFTRMATTATESEQQVLVPRYLRDDEVWCLNVGDAAPYIRQAGSPIEWLDLNIDGREWAKVVGT